MFFVLAAALTTLPHNTALSGSDRPEQSTEVARPDYVLPTEVRPGRVSDVPPKTAHDPPITTGSAESFDTPFPQSRQSYTTFDGRAFTLNAFSGRHARVLVPDAWLDPSVIPPAELWRLIDAADATYDLYAEMTGREPSGAAPASVAFVPVAAPNFGLGLIGAKGVEISDSPQSAALAMEELSRSRFFGPLSHEFEHNFDLATDYATRSPADPHAWTTLANAAALHWSRDYDRGLEPSLRLRRSTTELRRYAADTPASWPLPAAGGYSPNAVWAGTALRLAELNGPDAALGYFIGLSSIRDAGPAPSDPQARDDNHFKALSSATGSNAACAAAAWRWPLSGSAAADISSAYPGGQPAFCDDADGDGFSPLAGDCDDSKPSTNPAAAETANGADDDCNGIADDTPNPESSVAGASDLPSVPQAAPTLPFGKRLIGTLPGQIDVDYVRVTLRAVAGQNATAAHYSIILRAITPGSTAEARAFRPDGSQTGVVVNADQSVEAAGTVFTATPGQTLLIRVHKSSGDPSIASQYELTVTDSPAWPDDDPALINPPTAADGKRRLSAVWTDSQWAALQSRGVTHVRFWVTGEGWVGTRPAAQSVSFDWSPPAGETRIRGYRVEAVKASAAPLPPRPLASISQPYFFSQPEGPAVAQPSKRPASATIRPASALPPEARPAPSTGDAAACVSPLSAFRVNFPTSDWTPPWSPGPLAAAAEAGGCRHYPVSAAGWSLTIGGQPCEISSVRQAAADRNNGQPRMEVEAVVPTGANPGTTQDVEVFFNGIRVATTTACVRRLSPSFWKTADDYGIGVVSLTLQSILHPSLDLLAATPIEGHTGRDITLFGTGIRNAPDTDASNNPAGSANTSEFFTPALLVWTDGSGKSLPVAVTYAGPVPGGPCGLDQLNVLIPREAAGAGVTTLTISTRPLDGHPATTESVRLRLK